VQPNNPYQAPMAAPAAAPGGLATGAYEFDSFQNQQIEATASRTRMWGIVSLIGGILGLLGTVVFVIAMVAANVVAELGERGAVVAAMVLGFLAPIALVYTVVGKLYIDSGNSLRAVVTTEGNDVQHLMQALDKLANAFRIEVIMSVIAFVLGLVVGILAGAGVLEGMG
jgi:hypothetical protein